MAAAGVASADTSATPDTNTRVDFNANTVDATHGHVPGDTISGASAGDALHIHIEGTTGAFHGVVQTRLCRPEPGFDPTIDVALSPSNGDCIPPNANSEGFTGANGTSGASTPDATATSTDYTFSIGAGTETAHIGPGGAITCNASNPCALWIEESVNTTGTGSNPDGYVLKHYNITYAGAPSSPAITSTPGNGKLTIDLTPPAAPNDGNAPITGFSVTVTGPGGATQNGAGTHYVFNGLTNGTQYTVTATDTNTAANGTQRTSSPASSLSNTSTTPVAPPKQQVTQTIGADRPNGALVLTQVCGAYPGSTQAHTAPTYTGTAPPTTGQPDPLYSQYPYPQDPNTSDALANYPTNCGLQLATAKLITSGTGAGHFFHADGNLNEVTVVDTRDTNTHWTASATMGQFNNVTPGATDVLSGNELGWTPVRTSDSGCYTSSDGTQYCQTVSAGPNVAANQPDATGPLGLGTAVLGSAPDGHSLGIGVLDATLSLWIPVYAHNGHYTGTLTITVA